MPRSIALLLVAAAPALSMAQEPEWLAAPYIWASGISWDLAARGSGSLTAQDLAEKTDGAGLIRLEVARNKFGVSLDYVGLSISDGTSITTPGPVPVSIDVRAKVDVTIFELGGFYRPTSNETGLQYLLGFRHTSADTTLLLTPGGGPTQRLDDDPGFTDMYAGARYLHRINPTWDFSLRADYGFGETEGTLNLLAGVGWRSAGYFGLHFGYRHMTMEFDQNLDGERATSDLELSGPFLGFMFRF